MIDLTILFVSLSNWNWTIPLSYLFLRASFGRQTFVFQIIMIMETIFAKTLNNFAIIDIYNFSSISIDDEIDSLLQCVSL